MSVKKIINWLHRWLGLTSGLVVFIVGLTGCCYTFIAEIESVIYPYQHVKAQPRPVLLPSVLLHTAEKALPGKKAVYISSQEGSATVIGFADEGYDLSMYLHPYSGQVLKVRDHRNNFDFFNFILNGHRYLWMPQTVGKVIVDAAILIFVILLISGMVLWWPKNFRKYNRDNSFKIKWKAKWKRVNYDLHNVLGFYAMLVLLMIALTGLVWGYDWFSQSLYWTTSAGKTMPDFTPPLSDTLSHTAFDRNNIDVLWTQTRHKDPAALTYIFLPENTAAAIQVTINYEPAKNYNIDLLYFDQYSLKQLPGTGVFKQRFSDASFADQLLRLNYDLHTGQSLGLPTKILAFFASLICASLPLTGFYIWWGKRKKKIKKKMPALAH